MSRRALLAAVALAALVGFVAATEPFDGGWNCKYLNIRQIRENALALNSALTEEDINDILKDAATTNNYFCKGCATKRMQELQNVDQVLEGYGQCFCKENYGWYFKTTTLNDGTLKYKNWYGCTKCPDGFSTGGVPSTGPYRPGSLRTSIVVNSVTVKVQPLNRWTGTPCIADPPKMAEWLNGTSPEPLEGADDDVAVAAPAKKAAKKEEAPKAPLPAAPKAKKEPKY